MAEQQWEFQALLNALNIFGEPRKKAEQSNVPPEAFVAWRLKAATQAGLSAPNMWALKFALTNPTGAGDLFNDLANLGPADLAAVMYWAQLGGVGKSPEHLRQLALEFRQIIGQHIPPDAIGLRHHYRALVEANKRPPLAPG